MVTAPRRNLKCKDFIAEGQTKCGIGGSAFQKCPPPTRKLVKGLVFAPPPARAVPEASTTWGRFISLNYSLYLVETQRGSVPALC
jgi:hypothetical protein